MAIDGNVLCHLPFCSMSFPGGSLPRTAIDRPQQQLLQSRLHTEDGGLCTAAGQLGGGGRRAGGQDRAGVASWQESEDRVGRGGGGGVGGENRLGANLALPKAPAVCTVAQAAAEHFSFSG